MINLDALQELRYCHIPQASRCGFHLPTAQVQSRGKPYGRLKKFLTASRTLRDASNLTAKSVTTATVLRLLLLAVQQIDNSELRKGDVIDNFAVISRQEKIQPLWLM